ncbi:MAG: 30S ribosomal protein S3, partial [Planctomycetes bacterium]|nr:30S ribosomal protein S3 [Planctomycetota bacterium]
RVMRKAVETVMAAGAEGVKIRVGGRLGGAEIARAEKLSQGRIPLHTLRADIDYGTATAVITKGTIGIKVWICKGEKIPEKGHEKKHYVDAQKDKIPQVAKGHTQG